MMGIHFFNGTYSDKLRELVAGVRDKRVLDDLEGAFDLCSTAGYDNDGSTGPELVDNGVGLGLVLVKYAQEHGVNPGTGATIFWCTADVGGGTYAFYVVGLNEDDALARIKNGVEALTVEANINEEDDPTYYDYLKEEGEDEDEDEDEDDE